MRDDTPAWFVLIAAVALLTRDVPWRAIADALYTAAGFGLLAAVTLVGCVVARAVWCRLRQPRWAKWPPDSTLYPAGVRAPL